MPWIRKSDGQMTATDETSLRDVEFKPEEFRKELGTEIESKFGAFQTELTTRMKPMEELAAAIQLERTERVAAEKRAKERKEKDENEVTDEDFLLDPARAVENKMRGTNTAVMMLAARMAKQETLESKEYYHGDIKSKVDAMLSQQPLNQQTRADVIENCYKLVMYDHMKDIQEGKIKSRTSGTSFQNTGTGGHSAKTGEDLETMTADEKQMAKNMGLTEKDWISSRKELTYV